MLNKLGKLIFSTTLLLFFFFGESESQNYKSFQPGELWLDNNGEHINAHGGGILFHQGKYYWFGEHRANKSFSTQAGVHCYSSTDLYNWTDEGIALQVEDDSESPIQKGCIIERPKVIYNESTKQFVMYFHLELKDRGYEAAQTGVAVSNSITGPFQFIKSGRVNKGKWPLNMTKEQINSPQPKGLNWWTPDWYKAIDQGMFVHRDIEGGHMSRDMTLFVDDDGVAYHIYSSEDNLTLHIAELSDDYLDYTGRYTRVAPAGHNEAPAILKRNGKYVMITSGCTGWDPNEARLLIADEILGDWKQHPNPAKGEGAKLTFHSQSTYILPINGKEDAFIFMADRWKPSNLQDSRYIWLPIFFEQEMPVIKWFDNWDLSIFDK